MVAILICSSNVSALPSNLLRSRSLVPRSPATSTPHHQIGDGAYNLLAANKVFPTARPACSAEAKTEKHALEDPIPPLHVQDFAGVFSLHAISARCCGPCRAHASAHHPLNLTGVA